MNWREWFTPQAQDSLTTYRKEALHILLPIALVVRGSSLISAGYVNSPIIFYVSVFLFLLLSTLSILALVKGRISLSGVLLLLIFVRGDLATMLLNGYWDNSLVFLTMLNIVLAGVLLSSRNLDRYVISLVALYVGAALTMHSTGRVAPLQEKPWWLYPATLASYALLTWMMIRYLRHQLESLIVGQTHLIVSLEAEVTERKQVESVLREREERFRLISSVTSDYTFSSRFNTQGELEHIMLFGAFESITGYTPEEYLASGGWRATLHPDDFNQDDQDMLLLRKNQPVVSEVRTIKKSGEVRWVRVYAHPVWDVDQNQLIGINGGVQDINERKLAEHALRENEEKFRTFFEMSPYPIMILKTNGQFSEVNSTFLREMGISREQVVGQSLEEIGIFINGKKFLDYVSGMRTKFTTISNLNDEEVEIRYTDGRTGIFLFSACSVEIQAELHTLVIAVNITERRRAAEALGRSELHLRALLDATSDVAFLMARDGTLLTTNEALAGPYGKTVEEMVGRNAFDALAPDLRAQRYSQFERVIQSGMPVQWEDQSPTDFWANSVYPVQSLSGSIEAFAVYSRNITEQKRLEAELQTYTNTLEKLVGERTSALQRAKEQLELILNTTTDALAFAQPNGDIVMTNPAFLAMFDEQARRYIEGIFSAIADDVQVEAIGNALMKVIYNNEKHRLEAQIVSKVGGEKDIDLTLIPMNIADGEFGNGILLSGHDITQLKEIDRFKARFVADAVHDLATPISGLTTRLYLLKRNPEKLLDHVRALENQVLHLRNLLDDLRTLSQMDRGQIAVNMQICDLREMLQRVFDTYEPVALDKQQSLTIQFDPTLPEMRLDSRQMERVLVNLVSNAINYTPDGKAIHIEVSADRQNLLIRVTDQGIGINAEDLPRVFERFYRTDQARSTRTSGTGLGLAIVKKIVELHGGTTTVFSEPGHGSIFTVQLPLWIR